MSLFNHALFGFALLCFGFAWLCSAWLCLALFGFGFVSFMSSFAFMGSWVHWFMALFGFAWLGLACFGVALLVHIES